MYIFLSIVLLCCAPSSSFLNYYGYFRGLFVVVARVVRPAGADGFALTYFSCPVKSVCIRSGGVCMPSERSTLSPQRKWRFTVVSFDWLSHVLVLIRRFRMFILGLAWKRFIVKSV